jgi:hypothetical protein
MCHRSHSTPRPPNTQSNMCRADTAMLFSSRMDFGRTHSAVRRASQGPRGSRLMTTLSDSLVLLVSSYDRYAYHAVTASSHQLILCLGCIPKKGRTLQARKHALCFVCMAKHTPRTYVVTTREGGEKPTHNQVIEPTIGEEINCTTIRGCGMIEPFS